jgi:hypothetical protein
VATDADEEDVDSGWGSEDADLEPPPAPSKPSAPLAASGSAVAKVDPAKVGPPKADAPKAEPRVDAAMVDAAKADAPKVDAAKVDAAKADAAKADAAKADAAKADAAKADAAKADAAKPPAKVEAAKTDGGPKPGPFALKPAGARPLAGGLKPAPTAAKGEPADGKIEGSGAASRGPFSLGARPGALKPPSPATKDDQAASSLATKTDAAKDALKASAPKADVGPIAGAKAPQGDAETSPKPSPIERGVAAASASASESAADAASASKSPTVPPGKPASKAPPPKLAVGPRPERVVPAPPRTPSVGAPPPSEPDSSRATVPLIELDLDVTLGIENGPAKNTPAIAPRPPSVRPPKPDAEAPPASAPVSVQPKSRSFTPRVSNAVQQAKELDVRVANDPNVPTPPGTEIVRAALAAAERSDRARIDRPTPLRMPSASLVKEASEPPPPRPAVDAKPQTTSLRFSEKPAGRPIPRDRKQTLKLNIATQNFAVEMLSREADPASARSGDGEPTDKGKKVSAPMLDLHLPDDLGAHHDDGPVVEISDEGVTTDSFDDLPIDEVLEAVRQSSMPPPGSVPPDAPRISDIPLAAAPRFDDLAPISDLPPTVRGEPNDALRFAHPSEPPPPTVSVASDPRVAPIRERFDRGDFTGALLRAEALLEESPGHEGAKAFVQACQEKVKEMYISKLGSCEAVLRVVMSRDQIRDLSFDHRGGFLISLIDGVATVDDVLDISGMPQLEALRLLYELKQEGVIDSGPE